MKEALKLALEALEASAPWVELTNEAITNDRAIADIKEALAQPAQPIQQEPVAWADIQKEAQQIVESKFLWKKFIDGTPLSNDIACWMADFAQQYTTPPQPEQEPWRESASDYERGFIDGRQKQAQSSVDKAVNRMAQRTWVDLTDEDIHNTVGYNETREMYQFALALIAKLKEKNT